MDMLRRSIGVLFSLLFAVNSTAFGQRIQVQGNISTRTQPVRYCLVTFIDQADTTRRFSELTDTLGNYSLGIVISVPSGRTDRPNAFEVSQNYPNPFSQETAIAYRLPNGGEVIVKIYNILGQEVRTLLIRQQNSGVYQIVWDGRDEFGRKVSAGVYLYQIQTKEGTRVKKMAHLSQAVASYNAPLGNQAPIWSEFLCSESGRVYLGNYAVILSSTDSTQPIVVTQKIPAVLVQRDTTMNFVVEEARIVMGKSVDGVKVGDSTGTVVRKLGQPSSIILGDFPGFMYEYTQSEHAGMFVTISTDSSFGGLVGVVYVKVVSPYSGTTKDGVGIGTSRDIARKFLGSPNSSGDNFDLYEFDKIAFSIIYDQTRIIRIEMNRRSR